MFLISIKQAGNNVPFAQGICNEDDSLNLVRKIMVRIQPMEETSADLRAMKLLEEVKAGQAKAIEDPNGRTVVIQLHKGE